MMKRFTLRGRVILATTASIIGLTVVAQSISFATPPGTVDYVNITNVTVQAFGRDIVSPNASNNILFGAKVVATNPVHFDELIFAIRGPAGQNYDVGDRDGYDLGTAQQVFTATRPALPQANGYTVWLAYRIGATWTNLSPNPAQTFNVGAPPPPPPPPPPPGDAQPQTPGPAGPWTLRFSDEFSGTAVDTTKWAFQSSAEALWCSSPFGTGNPNNKQLEFDRPQNATVGGGNLTITATRGNITACGRTYGWTSSLLTSSPSYNFRYGYIEARADLPNARGFWPAFWTWQAAGNNQWTETDVFEYYSDNHNALYLSQHSGAGGGCIIDPAFDPSTGFHTYGADISPTNTRFYVDGVLVCTASGTSTGLTNILVDMFVFADVPPLSGTNSEQMLVDYVRAWQH